MKVLTIYNCGTAFDRNSNDLIANLASRTNGVEGKDWIINAGPGSEEAVNSNETPFGIADQLTGVGMYPAAIVSYRKIIELAPSVVNMIGWSRGSITSLMIARCIANQNISCNMLIFDPVVGDPLLNGFIHQSAPINSIGSHVKSLHIIQQYDATDFIFQAHVAHNNNAQSSMIYQLPGPHSGAVVQGEEKYRPVYDIGKGLAENFLINNKSSVKGTQTANSQFFLEKYSQLWLNLVGNSIAYVTNAESALLTNRNSTVANGNAMVRRVVFNQHHIGVLNSQAPKSALALMYVMTTKQRPSQKIIDNSKRERDSLSSSLIYTRQYLEKALLWLNMYN